MKHSNTGQSTVLQTGAGSLKTRRSFRLSGSLALLCSALFLSFQLMSNKAHAQIADYTGSGGTSTSVTYYSNESGSVLQKTGFGTNTSCSSGGLSGMTLATSITSFASGNPHVYITVTPNAGYVLNVTGLSAICRSSGTGATKARLAYSLDGGTTWTAESADHTQSTSGSCGASTNSFSWTGGLSLSGVTATSGIVVAIYPYSAGASGGTFQVNQLHLTGSVVASASCSGTPTAGTTSASTSTFCGSGSSLLTLSGASGGAGISYQWQSSATGVAGSYANITGATNTTYTTPSLTSTTYYQVKTTCTSSGLSANSTATTITVNPIPTVAAISGPSTVNTGSTISLTDATASGTWSSSTTSVGTVGSATGVVTGVSAGTTVITYSVTASGCTGSATTTVSVLATGTLATYIGTGGTSTSVTGIANETVGALTAVGTGTNTPCATGGLSGITVSTVYATYSAAGPHVYYQILPNSGYQLNVTGITAVTRESGTGPTKARLAYSLDGGATWIDDATDHAQVTGGSCGAASNTFSWTGGLTVFGISSTTNGIIVAVYPYAATASTGTVQVNSLTVFGNVNAAGSCGTVTGGTATAATSLFCNSGNTTVSLTGGTSGSGISYQWQNSADGITFANIAGATNTSYATSTLTATAYYQVITTCSVSTLTATSSIATVSVNPTPSAGTITGVPSYVYIGTPSTLSNAVTGGVWSSNHVGIATIGSATGEVNGVIPGTSVITYGVTTGGCTGTTTATVSVLHPNTIAAYLGTDGTSLATTSFPGDATTSLTAVGTGTATPCGSGGLSGLTNNGVTTFSTSNANVYFKLTADASKYIDVSGFHVTLRRSNSGISKVRMAYSLDNGATWSNDGVDQAPDNSGCSVSTTDFSYSTTLPTGINSLGNGVIFALYPYDPIAAGGTIQINAIDITGAISNCPLTPAISGGNVAICGGATASLSNLATGGTWSSSDNAVATVGTDGVVTGVTAGSVTISYTVSGVCGTSIPTTMITVNPLPSVDPVSILPICVNESVFVTDATMGGVWSSSDAAIATVGSADGLLTGISAGSVIISYTVTNEFGCIATATAIGTVNALPDVSVIGGTAIVCEGSTITLTNATPDGLWYSDDETIATIDISTGVVTGVLAGTVTIEYAVSNEAGCTAIATTVLTVNPSPVVATPSSASVCAGASIFVTDVTADGVWSSSDAAIATVGSADGLLMGVSAGTVTISYTVTNEYGCATSGTAVSTVNPLPEVDAIGGTPIVCVGAMITLTETTTGGEWYSEDETIATVDLSGVVTGVAEGTVNVGYAVTNAFGCTAIVNTLVTVNAAPAIDPITGDLTVAVGFSVSLADATTGGVWSSSNTGIATIGSADGVVTGVAAGNTTISYGVTNDCGTNYAIASFDVTASKAGHSTGVATIANEITLSPNPTTAVLHIAAGEQVNVSIFSVDGKSMMETKNAVDVNVSSLTPGVYVIRIYNVNNQLVKTARFTKN